MVRAEKAGKAEDTLHYQRWMELGPWAVFFWRWRAPIEEKKQVKPNVSGKGSRQ
jgi:hypothetical protein